MTYAVVNGSLVKSQEAVVSIDDRGFRFGDGVFETIPVHDGLPYLWEHHEKRLSGGLEALRIPFDSSILLAQMLMLLDANKVTQGILRIQISRGVGSRGYMPESNDLVPTVILQTLERAASPAEPVKLWLSPYEKIPGASLPTRFKLAQGLSSTLARMGAADHGCFDALQLGQGGCISEASSANIFWRKDGVLYTPSLDCGALAGVTRQRIFELWPHPIREGRFALGDLGSADAVILTNAGMGAIAVGMLLPEQAVFPQSGALATEINAMRNNDIRQYIDLSRESLARR